MYVSLFPVSKEQSHMVCPMCNKLFSSPKLLPCYHSYCEQCLEKMQEHSNIICLKCRNRAIVPAGGVKDLPNHYFMDNLINKQYLDYKLENEIELKCEECDEDDPVIVFCTNCKLFLCCFCKESHKYSKSHCSHNLISLTELKANKELIQSKSKFPTCQEHDLELEYYCETCEKLVCWQCWQCSGEHEDHKYDVVKKFADKYKKELKEIASSVDITIKNLSKLHDSIGDVRAAIRQQGDEISKEIDLYYDEAFKKLLEQKEKVKQQVHDMLSQKEKAMMGQLEEVICTQEDIVDIGRIRDAIEENSDQEVVSAKYQLMYSMKRLKERCKEMGTGPIESANIKVTPANEPLPQIVETTTISPLSFKVKFSCYVQQGQRAALEIITKDRNYYPKESCKVTAKVVETRTGENTTAQITDNNDGTYIISFATQQVGKMDLSVFVNEQEIKESPFRFVVQESSVKQKIITIRDNSFGQLCGIACSSNGMCAVADWFKNLVYVFNNEGRQIRKIGGRGHKDGQFKFPYDVAFDDNNKLYVSDRHNHRVQKFDANGNYLLQFGGKGAGEGQLNHPVGITSHQDKVYVADRENKRISVFQNDGKFSSIIGEGQLSQKFDIAINFNSEILVADWGVDCIYIFTLDGHCINEMTLHTQTGRVELKNACSLTMDSNGYIFIADTDSHCISIFDKIGNCISHFGSKGSNDDQFKFPRGIAIGPNGNIYISNAGNSRVKIFPPYCYS